MHLCIYIYVGIYAYVYMLIQASQVALVVNSLPANGEDAGDAGLASEAGRSPGGGNGNALQYSRLSNAMDRAAWQSTAVHGVSKS